MALETKRQYSLRNIGEIRNAYYYLYNVIRQLDTILMDWTSSRDEIETMKDEDDIREALSAEQ